MKKLDLTFSETLFRDLDDELVNLFRCVRDRPAEFLLELGLLPLNSRTEFGEWLKFHTGRRDPALFLPTEDVILDNLLPMQEWAEQMKKALHNRADYKEVLQATAFFKRMRNSYASSGRSFACQPFSVRTTFRQLEETSDRLSNVIVENQSFETLIPHYDREDSFFYLDPPYFKSEYVYEAEFGWAQHVLLRDTLANCKGKWLVSQSDFPEVRELFKDYYILEFKRIHSMAQRTHPGSQFGELLIGNYDLLEREREQREQPEQMSMTEMLGQPIDNEQILKERIIPCLLAALGFMEAIGHWNQWQTSLLYMSNPKLATLQQILMKIQNSMDYFKQNMSLSPELAKVWATLPKTSTKMAIVVVTTGPIIIAYPFFQKYFIKGITLGSVKG